MQLAPQTVEKLQDAAGFGFHYRLHDQLATAVEDRDHDRFLVHVHADILNVTTHVSCLLGGKIMPRPRTLSLKVKCLFLADLAIPSCGSCYNCMRHIRLQPSEAGRSFIMHCPL